MGYVEGKGLYQLTDPKANTIKLAPGEIAITYRLAKSLGVEVGDTVYWHLYTENTWYESQIGVLSRSPETAGIAPRGPGENRMQILTDAASE